MCKQTRSAIRPGAALVEFAAVAALFMLILFAIFEYSRVLMMRHLVDNAAREGARTAIVNTEEMTTADVQAVVNYYLAGQKLTGVTVTVFKADPATGKNLGAWNDAGTSDYIGVQVTADYATLFPTMGFLPNPVHLKGTAVMASEGN
jgi:Flp pilus assembly protein TadG